MKKSLRSNYLFYNHLKKHERVSHFESGMTEFFERFRKSKNTLSMVLDLIKPDIESITIKNKAITP